MGTTWWHEVDIEWPDYAPDEVLPGLHQGGTDDDDRVWIAAIRARRGRQVLCNEHFEEWLLTRAADTLVHTSNTNAA